MYLTGSTAVRGASPREDGASFEIDDPDQIAILARPQQLATVIKQGRELEFNSCPFSNAIGLLRDQWGSGQVRTRMMVDRSV